MINDAISWADVESKVRAYLNGDITSQDLDCWVLFMDEHEQPFTEGPLTKAADALGAILLMCCEMTLSGQLRTEEMFREDLESMLADRPMDAFWGPVMNHLVDQYTEQCQGMTA